MALPSQTERSSSSARVSASRTGGVPKAAITAGILILAVGGIAGAVWFFGRTPTNTPAVTPGTETADKNSTSKPKAPPVTPDDANKPGPRVGSISPSGGTNPPAPTPGTGSTPPTVLNQGSGSTPAPAPSGTNPAPTGTTPTGTTPTPASGTTPTDSGKPAPVNVLNPTGATPTPASSTTPTDGRPAGPSEVLPASGSTQDVRNMIAQGEDAQKKGELVRARQMLSKALQNPSTSRADQETLRTSLTKINDDLFFSKKITSGDPLVESYAIQSGDAISRLPRKRELAIDWRLLKRVNGMTDDDLTRLKVGQKIKLVRGPFHAVVHKSEYRLDIFSGSPDEPENWVYIRSFKVGLGEGNGTPIGNFVVKSRQVNPPWTNPRTGEKFSADDPKNPIGEYWVGWEGVGPSAAFKGFGIHGTIDPSSVGQQKSMGCVRLLNEDVAMVYEFLTERISVIQVKP